MTFQILAERPDDAAHIETLLDLTFGLKRKKNPVYSLRAGATPLSGLRFAAVSPSGGFLGTLRFWRLGIDGRVPAILLGPLAVEPALQGTGIGRALVSYGLGEAKRQGERICIVSGAPAYYESFGFKNAVMAGLCLPGPVAPERIQVLEIMPGALKGLGGTIHGTSCNSAEEAGSRFA